MQGELGNQMGHRRYVRFLRIAESRDFGKDMKRLKTRNGGEPIIDDFDDSSSRAERTPPIAGSVDFDVATEICFGPRAGVGSLENSKSSVSGRHSRPVATSEGVRAEQFGLDHFDGPRNVPRPAST